MQKNDSIQNKLISKRNQNTLRSYLKKFTKPGTFYLSLEDKTVQCYACAHQCILKPGQMGICQLRYNEGGKLMIPWGYVNTAQLDPIEKKPFNHFLPGALTLSFGMVGCNFHCSFCQNWLSAQALNDDLIHLSKQHISPTSPEELIRSAKNNHVKVIVSTYNEPLITSEWAVDIFRLAKEEGLYTAFVSNGYASPKGLKKLAPYLDAIKIDLKSFSEESYKLMGGHLQPVLSTIAQAKELGLWVEVVTLTIPDFNDSLEEVWKTARSIAAISTDIPWHVTAFHPAYKMRDRQRTSAQILQTTAEIGEEAGLRYVYAGNLPGKGGSLEDTHCPNCQKPVIQRRGFTVTAYNINKNGACKFCGCPIEGVWYKNPSDFKYPKWL